MSTEILVALIGVGGTVMGTILGYVLNECSKKGKIIIKPDNVELVCKYYGITNCTIGISLTLNIINSALEIKNIIKPKIVFKKGKKVLIEKHVKMHIDKSGYKDYLSCQPKVFASIKLTEIYETFHFNNSSPNKLTVMTEWFENCSLFLIYTDDRGKVKKKSILKDCLKQNEKFKNSLKLEQEKKVII